MYAFLTIYGKTFLVMCSSVKTVAALKSSRTFKIRPSRFSIYVILFSRFSQRRFLLPNYTVTHLLGENATTVCNESRLFSHS